MYTGMELYPWAWVFFVSFVLFGTFVVFNMLIGIILNSMEEARAAIKAEHEDQSTTDIKLQLATMQDTLDSMKRAIDRSAMNNSGKEAGNKEGQNVESNAGNNT